MAMKTSARYKLLILALLISANIFVFYKRDAGFEYLKFSEIDELYPANPGNSFLSKWSAYNNKHIEQDLKEGAAILNNSIGIDTISTTEGKVSLIGGWLFNSFYKQMGRPSKESKHFTVLKQYKFFASRKDQTLWCGNFQSMFGFFCTAAGLQNRYVEVVPVNGGVVPAYHEINEIYIPELKKWIMADITRNLLLLRDKNQVLSAAEYYNYNVNKATVDLWHSSQKDSLLVTELHSSSQQLTDEFFNADHFLRYYYTKDLSEVYSIKSRVKRYVFAAPWYEMYDPVRKHSNIFFRIKQALILITTGYIFFVFTGLIRKKQQNNSVRSV